MTAQTVNDATLGMVARKQADLFRRVREGTLDPQRVSDGLQALIESRFEGIVPALRFDKRKDGWKLETPESLTETPIEISKLEIVSFLKKGENYVSGETMRDRAGELDANFGQRQAEYLLDHQAEIPSSWRNFYLVFPGTHWRDSRGGLRVPCLFWIGGQWYLFFRWLAYDWGSHARVLRLRK